MPAMYVVIMAGGGGTRLRPLSTADRPKPFLPLLPTGETLLQRTIARLRRPGAGPRRTARSASWPPRRTRRSSASRLPGVEVVIEPEGRNTAAAIALAALAVDRDDDEVMLVLPADHRIDPDREGAFRAVLRDGRRPARDRGVRGRVAARHARDRADVPVHPVRLPRAARGGGRGRGGPPRLPAGARSARSRARPTPRRWSRRPAWPGTRACSCGGVGRSGRRSSGYAPDAARGRRGGARRGGPGGRLPADPLAVHRLRGHGARRRGRRGRDGGARRRVERHRHLARPARGARRGRRRRRGGRGRHRRSRWRPATCWWSVAPAGSPCGRPTVRSASRNPSPTFAEPATRGRSCRRSSTGVQQRRRVRDQPGAWAGAHPDRVRHRRVAGPGRGRVHVRERAPLRGRRGALRGGPRRAGEGRGPRLRPPVRLGALRRGGGRGPPGPRHPRRDQPDGRPHADVLVRGRASAARRRASSSRRRTTRGRTTGSRSRRPRGPRPAPTSSRSSRPGSPPTPAWPSSGGRSPMRRRRASSSGTTRTTATSGSSAPRSTSTRCGPRTSPCSWSRCTAWARAGSRACSPAAGSG